MQDWPLPSEPQAERIAASYATIRSREREQLRRIDALLTGAHPGKTLDIGCGPGRLLGPLHARGVDALGIDVSAAMLRPAARAQLRVVRARAEALPLRAASFDTVVSGYGALHFMGADAVLREAARVLRPGGRFACDLLVADGERPLLYRLGASALGHTLEVEPGPGLRSADELAPALARAGFAEPEVTVLGGAPLPPWIFPLPRALWRWAAHVVVSARRRR